MLTLIVLTSLSRSYAQNWFNDMSFYTGSGASSITGVQKLLVLSDDRLLIFGSYTTFNDTVCNRLVCLKANGGIDTDFQPGNGISSYVYDMLEQPDGKIILAGNFVTYNDTSYTNIVRIYPNGVIDETFDPGTSTNGTISECELQPDGKILLGGVFTEFGGVTANHIVRLNADGSIDNAFDTGTGVDSGTGIGSIVLHPDEKIVFTGNALSYNGIPVNRIFRVNGDGSLDPSFTIDLTSNQPISCAFRQSNGNYIVIGSFNELNGQLINHIAFLDPNGELIPTFSSAGFNDVTMLRGYLQDDDKIIIYGSFTSYDGATHNGILRLNPDGTVDPDFNLVYGANNWVQAVGKQSQPGLIVAGMFSTFQNETKNDITRIKNCLPETQTVYETACDTFNWPANGQTYTVSGAYTANFITTGGCDSTVTLLLTILPAVVYSVNTFVLPSDDNICTGALAVTASGNADFSSAVDGDVPVVHGGYLFIPGLCPGVHSLTTTNACGDTLTGTFVIPVDSNYVFNNTFIDSIAIDSLGATMEDCFIYYNGINTAYIDSIFANGNQVTVIWNIVDANGSNFDTTDYVLNNGNGVYYLQLSIFCPNKAVGEYFAVTEAIYFQDGWVSTAGSNEQILPEFTLFPNPAGDLVTLVTGAGYSHLEILDAHGKQVLVKALQDETTVSLAPLQAGIYIFRLISEKGSAVQRIVKY